MEGEELATAVLLSPTRDPAKNGEIAQRWMEMVLGEKFRSAFPAVLVSGELLCDLANKVFRALGMSDDLVADKSRRSDASDGSTSEAAMDNVRKYLSACEAVGVAKEDLFTPDDLLQNQDIGRVYRNILALQCVAVSMSSRRSIDERSSLVGANASVMDMSPLSEHGIFDEDDDDDQDVESPSTTNLLQQTRWQRLLFEYEYQLLRQADQSDTSLSDAHEGVGQLAHDIWRTEERIRTVIARPDRDYGLVPDDLHGKLWMLASGAQMEMRKHKGLYEKLVAMETSSTDATMQIDVDLHRTVSTTDKDDWGPDKTKMMRRVLVAYSFYNPSIGYCQGLNYIVARSLQYLQEEEAFFLLIKMTKLVPDDYYTTMLGLAVDQHVFADLVRIQLPDVAEHLGNLGGSGMDFSLACTEWFLTLFASPCEREVTIQVWDSIFLFGDELLFRVALALLSSAKDLLLKAAVYGDILKLLNELGKENLSPVSLLKSARKQDSVICARIDEFRAHHRLQLASGLVAFTDRDQQSRAGRTSSESKSEPRVRQLLGKKKKIFRLERTAGRLSRTYERNLDDEHIQLLRKEDQSRAKYYDGDALVVVEGYWGSADSYRQWGSRNTRMVHPSSEEKTRSKQRASPSGGTMPTNRMSAQTAPRLSASLGNGQGRERRSKSSALIPARKSSNPSLPIDARHMKDGENDSPLLGRSPKSWLQKRIDEWQKKNHKEKDKKKHDKNRHQPGLRADSERLSSQLRPSGQQLTPSSSAAHPQLGQCKNQSRSSNGTAFDRSKKTSRHTSDGPLLSIDTNPASELALSRSFSDPFHSPTDTMRPSSNLRDPTGQARHDAMNTQILIRSQDANEASAFATHGGSNSLSSRQTPTAFADESRPVHRSVDTSAATLVGPSTSAPVESHARARRRRNSSQNKSKEGRRRRSKAQQQQQQQQQPPPLEEKETPLLSNPLAAELLLDSPVHDRSLSVELMDTAPDNAMGKPEVRRYVSLPVGDPSQSLDSSRRRVPRNPKRLTSENAQAIRERAHVVSYIQRKASDASSLTGSFPVSPRERTDLATRLSTSSSESSREATLAGSARYRKGSFSFFDKLTSDLESLAGDLSSAFPDNDDSDDDKEPPGDKQRGVAV